MKNFNKLQKKTEAFNAALEKLHFEPIVEVIYNPLIYASQVYYEYWRRYASSPKNIVFLGMNPGPYGMAQTGIPFGNVAMVRDWMQLRGMVHKPIREHPKRPIEGFECSRSEVSGQRLWGFFSEVYPNADDFFAKHFVLSYCPLVFMSASGSNLTPDKFKANVRKPLEALCDDYLECCLDLLNPSHVVGVGAFAYDKLLRQQSRDKPKEFEVKKILHPSPASPAANHGWQEKVQSSLKSEGLCL